MRGNQSLIILRGTGERSIPASAGEPSTTTSDTATSRSIPASAGEPLVASPMARPFGVYPRECGGTALNNIIVVTNKGLSPRVRGNRDFDQ